MRRVLLLAAVLAAAPARAWQTNVTAQINNQVNAVAVDPSGDVVAAGTTADDGTESSFTVVKLAGDDGTIRWTYAFDNDGSFNGAAAVAVDAHGDVVAAGQTHLTECCGGNRFTVVKLGGATGAPLWSYSTHEGSASAVVIDAGGDVFAAGDLVVRLSATDGTVRWLRDAVGAEALALDRNGDVVTAGSFDVEVAKLSGANGSDVWRTSVDSTAEAADDRAQHVAVDRHGDVVVGARLVDDAHLDHGAAWLVAKLARGSGAPRWSRTLASSGPTAIQFAFAGVESLLVDPRGDVVAAGALVDPTNGADFTVVKLASAKGDERWRRSIDGAAHGADVARALALDRHRNVVVGGFVAEASSNTFTVAKLGRHDGRLLWRRDVQGTGDGNNAALAVAVDRHGDVVAGGDTFNPPHDADTDFTVMKFHGADGTDF